MKRVLLKKYQIIIIVLIQILFIIASSQKILDKTVIYMPVLKETFSINSILKLLLILIGSYIYISKKYWDLKEYMIYKVFAILNMIFICEMIFKFMILIYIKQDEVAKVNFLLSIGILVFLILNLVLFITYNRNVKKLENRNVV
ncbi:MAG: hypothetical protein ACRDDY_12310 [Clostridium sp.]|uniref:hypothetical protein n=1 Tax=Clostridium sp. TaxID=1506 RepID=UPI003EE55474